MIRFDNKYVHCVDYYIYNKLINSVADVLFEQGSNFWVLAGWNNYTYRIQKGVEKIL